MVTLAGRVQPGVDGDTERFTVPVKLPYPVTLIVEMPVELALMAEGVTAPAAMVKSPKTKNRKVNPIVAE